MVDVIIVSIDLSTAQSAYERYPQLPVPRACVILSRARSGSLETDFVLYFCCFGMEYEAEPEVEMATDETKVWVEMFIRASTIDKERKGSCPICQQFFMAYYIMSEQGFIDLVVTTVVPETPPEAYRDVAEVGSSIKLPFGLIRRGKDPAGVDISNMVLRDPDEIEIFLDRMGCGDVRTSRDARQTKDAKAVAVAENSFANLYKNFNSLLQNGNSAAVEQSLQKLENFLTERNTRFLLGDTLTYVDCELLPKLQHLRVAGKVYRNFEIPHSMTKVWNYLKNAYDQEAFQKSCPADQDLIRHYEDKMRSKGVMLKGSHIPSLQQATYTWDIPDDVQPCEVNGD